MKKNILFTSTLILLCSCSASSISSSRDAKPAFAASLDYKSNVKQENCYLCGSGKSLMPYYSKFDSIGLICLNTWQILDSRINNFDDEGNPIKISGSNFSYMNCGEDKCSFSSSTSSNRAMADLNYYYGKKSFIDPQKLCKEVCQNCLDSILEISYDTTNSLAQTHDAVLVDFKERKAYPLFKYSSFFIRDYYIHIDEEDDGISLSAIYCPEREK